ncbi:MAG TPA: hypothetical protein VIE36_23605 [Methylomirabilota bacterium]|jgi:hypothetical protein
MSSAQRAEKTVDRIRRGALPAPTAHTQLVADGDGQPCDGCGETIRPSETACTVSVERALDWRFHEVCYDAWLSFRHPT